MVDIRFRPIHEQDDIVFIRNERGEKPHLMCGAVDAVNLHSVVVQCENKFFHLTHHKRSFNGDHLINAIVLDSRPIVTGGLYDCTEYPIHSGDLVAFIEAPSQSFSTSLLIGEVIGLVEDGVKILVSSSIEQKYMRKPHEIVVIQTFPEKDGVSKSKRMTAL